MFRRRIFSFVSIVSTLALFCASCNFGDMAQNTVNRTGQELGNLGPQLGGALTGQDTYVLIPGFYEKLNPWIVNQVAFSAFLRKYKDINSITEKDRVDILIQLGILQNAPQWISQQGFALIDKYYPGLRKKRADNGLAKPIQLALAAQRKIVSDAPPCCEMSVAQTAIAVPPPVLLAAPATLYATPVFGEAVAFVGGINPVILTVLAGGLLLATAYEEIIRIKQQDCASLGGCNATVDNSVDVSSGMAANCQQEWEEARHICAQEIEKRSPNKGITGGFTDISNCARGLVSQACGGNKI